MGFDWWVRHRRERARCWGAVNSSQSIFASIENLVFIIIPVLFADVLSCAVAKNDVESIELLIEKYPDLMNRTHPLWSKPLLQVRNFLQNLLLLSRIIVFRLG